MFTNGSIHGTNPHLKIWEDHLDKIPIYDTNGRKLKNYLKLSKADKKNIQDMKGNIDVLKNLDISLLYKVFLL